MEAKMKIEFAEGCFDDFDGTQEELDELKKTIETMFESGELGDFRPLTPEEEQDLLEHLNNRKTRQ